MIRVNPYWWLDPSPSKSGSSNQTENCFIFEPGASRHEITDQTKSNQTLSVRAHNLLSRIKSFFQKKLSHLQDSKFVKQFIHKKQIEIVSPPPFTANEPEVDSSLADSHSTTLPQEPPPVRANEPEVNSSLADSRLATLPQEPPIVSPPPANEPEVVSSLAAAILPQEPPIVSPPPANKPSASSRTDFSNGYTRGMFSYVGSTVYNTTSAVCGFVSYYPFGCISSLASGAMSATSNVFSVAYAAAEAMVSDFNPSYFPEVKDDESDKPERSDSPVVEVPPEITPPAFSEPVVPPSSTTPDKQEQPAPDTVPPTALPLVETPVSSQASPAAPAINLKIEDLPCTPDNEGNVGYLIDAFVHWRKASLIYHQAELLKKFKAVNSVHPLKLLFVVFSNLAIKRNMLEMFKKHPIFTSALFYGFTKYGITINGMNETFNKSNIDNKLLPYLNDFARITHKDLPTLRQFVEAKKWVEMFHYVLDYVPT